MRESLHLDDIAPEARAAMEEDERLPRWPLIPRWFKALVVASPVFGVSLGLNWDFAHALAFAALATILFVIGVICYGKWRIYRENRLPS